MNMFLGVCNEGGVKMPCVCGEQPRASTIITYIERGEVSSYTDQMFGWRFLMSDFGSKQAQATIRVNFNFVKYKHKLRISIAF